MKDNESLEKTKELYEQNSNTNMQYISLWTEEIIFSWRWWVSILFTLLPWILWGIFRKKESSARLIGVGFFTMFLTAWMDFIGVDFGLWYYPIDAIPFVPSYIPYDFCVLPVMVMFLIQYKPHISPFWKARGYNCFYCTTMMRSTNFEATFHTRHPFFHDISPLA